MIIPIEICQEKTKRYDITIDKLPKLSYRRKVAIVTNTTVAPLHLEYLLDKLEASQVEVIELPDGEEYKTMDTVLGMLDRLFEARFDRHSLLIALGGGVIGDMTGFTASLYQRGIDFIQMPTTLLSQVDASVGGKTGVNNKWGKNLIGAFYQPKAVYIDPIFLKTLPAREYSAGIAEVVKMAVMFDIDFFEFLEKNNLKDSNIAVQMIAKSVKIKANVVNQDEKEAGIRAVLNYGHTFAHVIENETNYSKYLHGEAVSIGIVMANRLAIKLGLLNQKDANRVLELLKRYNLPVEYKIKNIDEFFEHFYLDKKSMNNKIKFILPNKEIGSYTIKSDIPKEMILDTLKEFSEAK